MTRTWTIVLVAFALAACGDEDVAAPATTTTPATTAAASTTGVPAPTTALAPTSAPTAAAPSTPPPAPVTAAPTTAAPAASSDLPPCAEVQPDYTVAGTTHPDCSLTTAGAAPQVFEVRFGDLDADSLETPMTITALDGTQPPIEESVGDTFASPTLDDLDGDGTEELLAPLFTGAQNTSYAVWARPSAGEPFGRAGEVGGLGFGLSADGYVVVLGHASASASYADLFRLEAGVLSPIVSLERDVVADTCTLTDSGGLASTGLDAVAAQERFCTDPSIAA